MQICTGSYAKHSNWNDKIGIKFKSNSSDVTFEDNLNSKNKWLFLSDYNILTSILVIIQQTMKIPVDGNNFFSR